jgi:hypothetical protein
MEDLQETLKRFEAGADPSDAAQQEVMLQRAA